ncbi:hypothetical protein B0T24DRAFT_596567 [Lasiosphaeria ovina]|uniref:DUF7779 domain-containing protein n=1 Tax=Lasiosphaeria ovina TaxID=92902 RepID=A0AAE0JYE3_9PEZI|nr:hypothetical protein B0T24DRAFT_596567 [Lasiosphaeria ovina]
MGKSSIAIKFVYDHFDVYNPFIFWFSADTLQKATVTAVRVCKELGVNLSDPAHELTQAASAWRAWLEQNDSWLAMYDNVEDESLLQDLWPRNNFKGTIIVTSRRPNVTGTLVESDLGIDLYRLIHRPRAMPNDAVASLPLAMLWEANIASLPDEARTMLQVMDFLDPDNVYQDMLLDERVVEQHTNVLPADRETYLHCLRNLSEYSLIRRDRSMLCVHRLSEHGLLMSSVVHLAQSFLPHVEALGKRYHEFAKTVDCRSLHLAELMYTCSWSMYERGILGPAVKLARTGLDIATTLPYETRLPTADLWKAIRDAQLEGSGLQESYNSLKLALIANSYMALGTAAVGIGHAEEAMELGERSIALRLGCIEEQIQMFAMSHHNVALAALHSNRLDKAEEFVQKSIELTLVTSQSMTAEQKLAMDSRNIYCRSNILWARGLKDEAWECHQKALQIRIGTFDEVHPYTACAYWKLGQIWEEDDWQKAEYVLI